MCSRLLASTARLSQGVTKNGVESQFMRTSPAVGVESPFMRTSLAGVGVESPFMRTSPAVECRCRKSFYAN